MFFSVSQEYLYICDSNWIFYCLLLSSLQLLPNVTNVNGRMQRVLRFKSFNTLTFISNVYFSDAFIITYLVFIDSQLGVGIGTKNRIEMYCDM